jgi:hypothetical protein
MTSLLIHYLQVCQTPHSSLQWLTSSFTFKLLA